MPAQQSLDVGHVAARVLQVGLPMGLTLDEVILEGEGLHLETHPLRVSLYQPGKLQVRIGEESLAGFLNTKAPGGLKDFRVRLLDDYIHVEAMVSMIISINVGAVCRLVIEDETKLVVELVRIESIGGSGAHNLVQKQLDSINPVLDAKDLPVDATFSSVLIEDHWL